MLITDKFVLLNYPKTGSTFAREAIQELYHRKCSAQPVLRRLLQKLNSTPLPYQELMMPNIKIRGVTRPKDQHGCYCQIPEEYKDREIVTVIRNPYTRFLSAYTFEWWKQYPPISQELVEQYFPHFPNLSFDDYVDLTELGVKHGRLGREPGNVGDQTAQFIQMFFNNPAAVLDIIDNNYLLKRQYLNDIPNITFLRQESLNDDLADFLITKGFTENEVAFIREKGKVNTSEVKGSSNDSIWTEKTLTYVREKEKAIFDIYESKGIKYNEPTL